MKMWIERCAVVTLFLLSMMVGFFVMRGGNQPAQAATPPTVAPEVLALVQAKGSERVIVQLRKPIIASAANELNTIATLQSSVLDSLGSDAFTLTHRFHSLPAFAGVVTQAGMDALQANPLVESIGGDLPGRAHLRESVPALRADVVSNTYGITGKGVTVAVLDSGVDTTHSDLQNSITGQHCFTENSCQPGNQSESSNAQDTNGHGTNIAGIITSDGKLAPHGFATDAKIVAVRVLDSSGVGRVSDWIAGLDWLNSNFATTPVDVINLSLGTDNLYASNCDANQPVLASAIANLRSKGVVFFASSGNDGDTSKIAAPACISGVVAVGATYDSNEGREPNSGTYSANCFDETTSLSRIACFSNSNDHVDILAPGAMIESTGLGGGSSSYAGTSQAAATAAAVAALMLEKDSSLTPDEVETLMKSSGIPITDTRNSLVFRQIRAITAVNAVDFYNHVAPTSVAVGGASNGYVNTSHDFTATVLPDSTSLPLTYTWEASEIPISHTTTGNISATYSFSWSQPGIKTITVTAQNDYGLVVDTHTIEIIQPNNLIPLSEVVLDGPYSSYINSATDFMATVAPLTASLPVTYTWQAAGQSTVTVVGGLDEGVSFAWSQLGSYPITVTATNAALHVVTDTLQIQVKSPAPQSISLKGSASGAVGQSMTFLASVLPVETQTPITFTWQATGQPTKIRVSSFNDSVNYTWQQAGVYTVSVQAENRYGTVAASRMVTISAPTVITPLEGITLQSADSVLVKELLYITATVSPESVSLPITYFWEPSGQSAIEQVTGTNTSIVLSWNEPGNYPITVTATNAGGAVSETRTIQVRKLAPLGVIIDGSEQIITGAPTIFTASLIPFNTGLPVTYTWSATDHVPLVQTGGTSDEVSFSWDKAGIVSVQVEAVNSEGRVSGEKIIQVATAAERLYLPLIQR